MTCSRIISLLLNKWAIQIHVLTSLSELWWYRWTGSDTSWEHGSQERRKYAWGRMCSTLLATDREGNRQERIMFHMSNVTQWVMYITLRSRTEPHFHFFASVLKHIGFESMKALKLQVNFKSSVVQYRLQSQHNKNCQCCTHHEQYQDPGTETAKWHSAHHVWENIWEPQVCLHEELTDPTVIIYTELYIPCCDVPFDGLSCLA